jgi:hypothetical protein
MRSRWARIFRMASCLGWGAGAWLPAHGAAAQSALDFSLDVEAAADARCISDAALKEQIQERVGRLVFLDSTEPARRIHVRLQAAADAQSWSADIVMVDDSARVVGERQVASQGASCRQIDEALVLVISTMIGIADEEHKTRQPAASDEPAAAAHAIASEAAPAQPPAAPPPSAAAVSRKPASAPVHVDWLASLAASAELGLLPSVAPGASLALDADFGGWGLFAAARFLPYAVHDLGAGASARFMSVAGDVRLCLLAARPLGALLDLCTGAQAGSIFVTTSGLYGKDQYADPNVRLMVGPRLRAPCSRNWGFLVGLDAAVPVLAPRYFFIEAGGDRRYYHSVGLGVSGQIGAYWRFSS